MDERQRKCLEENLVVFCENLDVAEVMTHLQSKGILRDHHEDEILSTPVMRQRRNKLVRSIKTRGPEAFSAFHNALVASEQNHLAKLLEPCLDEPMDANQTGSPRASGGRSRSPSPDPIVYPADEYLLAKPELVSPNNQALKENMAFYRDEVAAYNELGVLEPSGVLEGLTVDVVDGNSLSMKYLEDEKKRSEVYAPSRLLPKGLALVINNKHFRGPEGLPERVGTDVDETNITRTLQQLGYKVKIKKDLSAEGMMEAIIRHAAHKQHKSADSTVVVVLTHGEHGELFGSDEKTVKVDEFVSKLDANNCPALRGVPKLFFLQACRGKQYDRGHYHDATDTGSSGPMNGAASNGDHMDGNVAKKILSQVSQLDQADALAFQKLPLGADVLIAYATTPGYVSWRNSLKGSWFVQSLCEVFAKNAANEDILSMLTMVNNRVAKAFQSSDGCFKQIPEPSFRLTKKFYFYPGFAKNSPSVFGCAPSCVS